MDWVKNPDCRPDSYERKIAVIGRIRIIICERSQYEPLDFPITREMFEEVEKEFHLHPATLSAFERHAGTFSKFLTFDKTDRTKLKRVGKFGAV